MTTNKGEYNKKSRVLSIYERLQKGNIVNSGSEAQKWGVCKKTIYNDISFIKDYLAQYRSETLEKVEYEHNREGYLLKNNQNQFITKKDILAIAKILLESRAFNKKELNEILDKLILNSISEERKKIKDVIENEKFHYEPIKNAQPLIAKLWDLSKAVRKKKVVKIEYISGSRDYPKSYRIKPVGVMFSDFYFYLIANKYKDSNEYPIIFRIDRIEDYKITDQRFKVKYLEKFKEGEFRKRVQFMHSGELYKIEFKYFGDNPEPVLDRLPTAEIINEEKDAYLIKAEVYGGHGLKMWLLTQSKYVEILKPKKLRVEMKELINEMVELYD